MSNSIRTIPNGPGRPAGDSAPLFSRLPRLLPLALLLSTVGGSPAVAGPSDALHVYGSVGYFHDDNLFRLPDSAPGFDGQKSDSALQTVLGVFFDKTYSRQKVFLQAKRSKVKFDHFKQLDYDGKDYLARLNWEVGKHFSGSVGASYAQTLAPYTDFRSRERNLREQERAFFDGAWRFHPSWRVRTGATRDEYTYELAVQKINDRVEKAVEVGVDYLPRSGSTAGLVVRRVEGDYLNRRVLNNFVLNGDFEQDELKAKIDWRVTPISTVQVLAGHVRRKSSGVNQRDTSGFNGRVTVSSQPRVKLRVNAALYREFTPVESSIVTYALSRGASAGATWDASAKIRVDGAVSTERRAYQTQLAIGEDELKDTIRRASLDATWSPRPALQVVAGFARERRTGSLFLGTGTFKANTVSLNASAQF